ncbi:hypothetical protein AB0A73_20075 [Glycomyces sp. NPDC047369]
MDPSYPFNSPNEPIELFDGSIAGVADSEKRGRVLLTTMPNMKIIWEVESNDPFVAHSYSDVELILRRVEEGQLLHGFWTSSSKGIANSSFFGSDDTLLDKVITHWLNVPNWYGPIILHKSDANDSKYWRGRWRFETDGWIFTFDARPDHKNVFEIVKETHANVITHVMEVRRADGSQFTPRDIRPVIDALEIGISFAVGRRIASILPVGFDSKGVAKWEEWGAPHCDPVKSTSSGWWWDQDLSSLAGLLETMVKKAKDRDAFSALRMQLILAISSISDRGFLELRITNGAAGLEHLEWQSLALSGRISKAGYKNEIDLEGIKMNAAGRLRLLLKEAKVDSGIDEHLLPAMAAYARMREGKDKLDGPDIVTRIRNKLVHPKGAQESIYRHDGLLREVWCVTRHYLSLLVLHSLGYEGSYRDLRKLSGWASEVVVVPWKDTA